MPAPIAAYNHLAAVPEGHELVVFAGQVGTLAASDGVMRVDSTIAAAIEPCPHPVRIDRAPCLDR